MPTLMTLFSLTPLQQLFSEVQLSGTLTIPRSSYELSFTWVLHFGEESVSAELLWHIDVPMYLFVLLHVHSVLTEMTIVILQLAAKSFRKVVTVSVANYNNIILSRLTLTWIQNLC